MNSARWGIVMTGLFLCALFGNAQARLIIEKPVQNSSDSILLSNTTKPSTDEVKKKQFDLGGQWSADTLRPNHNTPADTAHLTLINDSLLKVNQKTLNLKSRFSPDPKRALWLSLVFPGAGQIYNRKYWKLPIIYGGFLGCTYALMWNQQMYRDYSQAYLDIMDDDPNTTSDLLIIDAYVDAQLSEFDITPDLSMRLEPAVIQNKSIGTSGSNNSYGVGCSFKF